MDTKGGLSKAVHMYSHQGNRAGEMEGWERFLVEGNEWTDTLAKKGARLHGWEGTEGHIDWELQMYNLKQMVKVIQYVWVLSFLSTMPSLCKAFF